MFTVYAPTCLVPLQDAVIYTPDGSLVYTVFIPLRGQHNSENKDIFRQSRFSPHKNDLVHLTYDGSVLLEGNLRYNGQSPTEYRKSHYGNRYQGNRLPPFDWRQRRKDDPTLDDFRSQNCVRMTKVGDRVRAYHFTVNFNQESNDYYLAGYTITEYFDLHLDTRIPYVNYMSITGTTGVRGYGDLSSCVKASFEFLKGLTVQSRTRQQTNIFVGSNDITTYDMERLPLPENSFKFNELTWWNHYALMRQDPRLTNLRQHATYDALSGVKILNENMLSNILDICSLISDIRHGKFVETNIPKNLWDAWLAYRYQFCTTKADVEDAIGFIRQQTANIQSKYIYSYGFYADSEGRVCRCKLTLESRLISDFTKVYTTLYKYGICPNFYTVWDTLPFSFVLDWAVPIGDVLSVIDKDNYYSSSYKVVEAEYSLSYGASRGGANVHLMTNCYTRWHQRRIQSMDCSYFFEDKKSSSKSILFRCLDAASLILGRK